MKPAAVSLTLAFSFLSLAAQSAASATGSFSVPGVSSDCPVSMQLQQRLGSQVETVQKDGRVYKAPATQLILTVTGSARRGASGSVAGGMEGLGSRVRQQPDRRVRPLRIASATAMVYGFGSRPRYELISPGPEPKGNGWSGPTRKLQLRFTSRDGSSMAELWLPGFGAVRGLNVDSITYADGSTWTPARGESCTVTPSLLMLVGADSAAGQTKP